MTRSLLVTLLALVAGCGPAQPRSALSAGWVVQHDDQNVTPVEGRFQLQSDGSMEIAPGPNADVWSQLQAAGNYCLSVDVTHLDSGLHPHGAGLLFGGRQRGTAEEHYGYFLVRGDRCFLVKMRRGEETRVLANWTEHPAIAAEDPKGVMHNRLTVEVMATEVRFLVNGTEVQRLPRQGFPSEGAMGYRLVHDLHVRFGKLELEQLP